MYLNQDSFFSTEWKLECSSTVTDGKISVHVLLPKLANAKAKKKSETIIN